MRKTLWMVLILAGLLAAMGPSPRYLEELVIGGGYGSPPDGGMDLEADGNVLTDGSVTVGGAVTLGGNLAVAGDTGLGVDYTPGARLHVRTASDGDFAPTLLLHNASQTVGTAAGVQFQTAGADVDRAKGAIIYESTTSYGRGDMHFLNSDYAGAGSAGLASDIRMTLTNDGRLLITQYLGTLTDHDLLSLATGAVSVNGDLDAGVDGLARGVLTAWDGVGGTAPGVVRLHAPGGSDWFLFVEDDGTLRIHDVLPTSNTDGSIVGLQN